MILFLAVVVTILLEVTVEMIASMGNQVRITSMGAKEMIISMAERETIS